MAAAGTRQTKNNKRNNTFGTSQLVETHLPETAINLSFTYGLSKPYGWAAWYKDLAVQGPYTGLSLAVALRTSACSARRHPSFEGNGMNLLPALSLAAHQRILSRAYTDFALLPDLTPFATSTGATGQTSERPAMLPKTTAVSTACTLLPAIHSQCLYQPAPLEPSVLEIDLSPCHIGP